MFKSKSSKATKCKTAARMVVSRIKLLRNKRETQLKHLKADIARLLENNQEESARSRVEHAIREQRMIEAYAIIENCCELLINRVASISLQKTCPQDLLEPIANLIFAAPRCGDLPELQDIRSVFTDKYGKHFVACILELREGCGVSKKMIEKFATHLPYEKKVDYMVQVAAELNVKWTPTRADEVKEPTRTPPTAPAHSSLSNTKVPDVGSPKSPLQVKPIPRKEPVVESEGSEDEMMNDVSRRGAVSRDEKQLPVTEIPKRSTVPRDEKQVPVTEVPRRPTVSRDEPLKEAPKRGAVSGTEKQFIPFATTKLSNSRASEKVEDPKRDPYSQFSGYPLNPYQAAGPVETRVNPDPYEAVLSAASNNAYAAASNRLNPYEATAPAPPNNPYEATAPAPSKTTGPAPAQNRPSLHEASLNHRRNTNSSEVSPAISPASVTRSSEYKRTSLLSTYSDVASAAEAAAESAEHAAAAARVAADLANKELSRASSSSSLSKGTQASRVEVPHWKEKVQSYLMAQANDTESSDWGTPSARTPPPQELNPNRRWEKESSTSPKVQKETLTAWHSSDLVEKESKTNFWSASLEETRSDAQVEFLKSSVSGHEDVNELFRTPTAKLDGEKQVFNDRKPVFDDYKPPVFDQQHRPVVQSVVKSHTFDEEPVFDEGPARQPAFDDLPAFDEPITNSRPQPVAEQRPTFNEQPAFNKQLSRLDSVSVGLQTMSSVVSSKLEQMYASSDDEEEKPRIRNRQTRGQQDVDIQQQPKKAENADRELRYRNHDEDVSSSRDEGRTPGWFPRSTDEGRAPAWRTSAVSSSNEGSRLDFQKQFHGAKNRVAAASVRTRRVL